VIADDVPDLLRQIDGRSVWAAGKTQRLMTAGVEIVTVPPDWRQMEWVHTTALETHLLSGRAVRTEILLGDYGKLWERKAQPKGPLAVFGYDYFAEHAKAAGIATPKLLSYEGLWGVGEEYAYEVLNFANGKRNTQEIRDAVSAEYRPVEMVLEYLQALEKIGVVERMK